MDPTTKNHGISDNIAENYQRFFVPAIATPASRELLRTADIQPGERVVDVACGTGHIARLAAEKVGQTGSVTGVDIAPNMIAAADSVSAPAEPRIDWHVADAKHLPLSDASFDAALCQMGLMFIDDRTAALAEILRVLAPGGRAVINTPGRIQPVFEQMERAISENINPRLGMFVRAVFSMNEPEMLTEPLLEAGFKDVSATETNTPLRLPPAAEFLWQYVNMTPMAPIVAQATAEARKAAENQFVENTRRYSADDDLVFEQPIITAIGRSS